MGIKSRNVPQNDWSLAGRGTLARERKRMAHKKEVWDGDRFCKLSWFWDPNAVWCLPAKCKPENCKNVLLEKPLNVCMQVLRD